ncbi:MAG: hypothetical protein KDA28_05355, partial [Phycisphaerales bacterium]|nr:hypothetical protein [Phycisphaerales bacterium]
MRSPIALVPVLLASLASIASAGPVAVRFATFNVEDVRTADLRDPSNPRLRQIAEVIQRLRPNVLLLNEIAYDMPGAPGCGADHEPGQNAALFVRNFLETPQHPDLRPITYRAFQARPNTGMPSGMDLDKDGEVVTSYDNDLDAEDNQRFGNDAWGFGRFPGQYGMALLVDPRLD